MTKETPMMIQYKSIKKEHPEAILFMRMGDFYEMFCEDAVLASDELDLVLTAKNAGAEGKIPMCGVPYHAADSYIQKLLQKGYRVAMCEQLEDPKLAKGLVKRDVIRVISPGTLVGEALIPEESTNYLACVIKRKNRWGLCYTDISTGEFNVTEINDKNRVFDEIFRIGPKELLFEQDLADNPRFREGLLKIFKGLITELKPDDLKKSNRELLREHFFANKGNSKNINNEEIQNADCSPEDENAFIPHTAKEAAAICLAFLHRTQLRSLSYINSLKYYTGDTYMVLDTNTRRNLELTATLFSQKKQGSLFWVLDSAKTPMGKRMLKEWIENPLLRKEDIVYRRDGVKELIYTPKVLNELTTALKQIKDLQRLSGSLSYGEGKPADLLLLKKSVGFFPQIFNNIKLLNSPVFQDITGDFDILKDVYDKINSAISDDATILNNNKQIVKTGFSETIDNLRQVAFNGKQLLIDMEAREREATGIKNLKIKYNKVFGYFIEVSNSFLDKVPESYIRKQTLVNGERFYTPELKEFEESVTGAEDKLRFLELAVFNEVRDYVSANSDRIMKMASYIGIIDCLQSLAHTAIDNNYCYPEITDDDSIIIIKDGRHPMVEKVNEETFIANDTVLDGKDNRIMIITGPNMAGKSTFMRQTALIILMAQIGSYVPAASATIGICDRLFTRIGASDDLIGGNSTFMVEMKETADILSQATGKSFVILDEIGRGTSTFDGMSLAKATLNYISNSQNGPKTLFATHYHELTSMEDEKDNVKNYAIRVDEVNGNLIFLRKVTPGKADKSYGIQVARLAGLPVSVINDAKKTLRSLEKNKLIAGNANTNDNDSYGEGFSLFREITEEETEIIDGIRKLDIDNLRPIEALRILEEWKNYLDDDK